jgi:hypothetical protein
MQITSAQYLTPEGSHPEEMPQLADRESDPSEQEYPPHTAQTLHLVTSTSMDQHFQEKRF